MGNYVLTTHQRLSYLSIKSVILGKSQMKGNFCDIAVDIYINFIVEWSQGVEHVEWCTIVKPLNNRAAKVKDFAVY